MTFAEIRKEFWKSHPTLSRTKGRDGDWKTDTRCAFVDFVDHLCKAGRISAHVADRITL